MAAMPATDPFSQSATWESGPAAWSSGDKRSLLCCRVIAETHDVKTFVLRAADARPVAFLPGQFITLSLVIDGQPVSRCYTLASAPTRPYTLSITVKRVPGGRVSNWLHDTLTPGATLEAYGPAGVFTPAPGQREKLLYLSAGSGVTPLMSMTRASIDLGLERDIVFVHSARSPADIVFRTELAQLQALSAKLQVIQICEATGAEPGWTGPLGRLSLELLQQQVPDFRAREVFTCGPAGYMAATQALLLHGGHAPAHYHQESFDLGADGAAVDVHTDAQALQTTAGTSGAARATAAASGSAPEEKNYTIRLAKSNKTVAVSGAQMLLASLRRAGIPVPSSCGKGLCGTCKTGLLEGTVAMHHQGGIRQREIDKGLRLLCCSRPESDLVLDL